MKKLKVILTMFSLLVFISGCQSNNTNTNNESNKSNDIVNTNTTNESDKLNDFVNSIRNDVQKLSNDTISADIVLRDNSLVYVYKYTNTYPEESLDIMKASFEKSLDSYNSTYTNLLTQLKQIDKNAKSVILEYYNGDGTLIYSKEFE